MAAPSLMRGPGEGPAFFANLIALCCQLLLQLLDKALRALRRRGMPWQRQHDFYGAFGQKGLDAEA